MSLTDLVDRYQTGLSIGGEWRPSSDGGSLVVLDPATAQPLTAVANGTADDAMDAVGREGSHEGMMEFLETKYIAADW